MHIAYSRWHLPAVHCTVYLLKASITIDKLCKLWVRSVCTARLIEPILIYIMHVSGGAVGKWDVQLQSNWSSEVRYKEEYNW